ncbi:MAG: regulatory protein RecX [Vicinamibacterales bacterium]
MRRSPKSRGSASSDPPDAFTTALTLLGQRELSESQIRDRLARRGCQPADIDAAVARLRADRTLDDARVARAAARLEAAIRGRGPARVRQRLRALGLAPDVVQDALADTFAEVDQDALLEQALDRRLGARSLADLDDKARARLARGLIGQGFAPALVLARVREKGRGRAIQNDE